MLKKLLICPWFGDLPPWWENYRSERHLLAEHGYDFLLAWSLAGFRVRVLKSLGLDCPIVRGSGKIHDYRAAFGHLYADELEGYDYWGHTDFDCVYGRVEAFMPDDRLAELDVYSDHPSYLCGPWTLYRNTPALNEAFRGYDGWQEQLEQPATTGWVETGFTDHVDALGLRVLYELNHGYQWPERLEREGRALLEDHREISFYHFKRSKVWPQVLA